MISSLPPETTDSIIDHLWDDQVALANCALTCKAWLPTGRRHLYLRPSINSSRALHAFLRAAASPVIADAAKKAVSLQLANIQETRFTVLLPPLCPAIEALAFYHVGFTLSSKGSAVAIRAYALWTRVKSLTLDSMSFRDELQLPQLLCAFPMLRRLSCGFMSLQKPGVPIELGEGALPPTLDALRLVLTPIPHAFATWLMNGPTADTLRELQLSATSPVSDTKELVMSIPAWPPRVDPSLVTPSLYVRNSHRAVAGAIVKKASGSLEVLSLTGIDCPVKFFMHPDERMEDCRSLKKLHLNFEAGNDFHVSFLAPITTGGGVVKDLSIRQVVDRVESFKHDWGSWSTVFSGRRYSELQRLSLAFTAVTPEEERDSAMEHLEQGAGKKRMRSFVEDLRERGVHVQLDIGWQILEQQGLVEALSGLATTSNSRLSAARGGQTPNPRARNVVRGQRRSAAPSPGPAPERTESFLAPGLDGFDGRDMQYAQANPGSSSNESA